MVTPVAEGIEVVGGVIAIIEAEPIALFRISRKIKINDMSVPCRSRIIRNIA